ncbi:MAG: hypothetical protein JNK14_15495 [Chitinophagaceae bacterium]|nr:hypothetical protein [Chitinophagaceae bacterium]
MRRLVTCFLLFSLFSCKTLTEMEKLHRDLSGKWLVLYPDHDLKNDYQKVVYSKIQDSIVGLSGLKLVTLADDGSFMQLDSLHARGKWGITGEKIVFVENGGKGFENFSAAFTGYEKGVLKLTEYVRAEGEKIRLVWHLKKIRGGSAEELFSNERNTWRKKPIKAESEKEIRQRLSAMLSFYAAYYSLVTKESSFFVPTRVILPLRFYQHAIGMKDFDADGFFAGLFYDRQQAAEAHRYLSVSIRKLRNDFPKMENYVEEYAAFMKLMAQDIAAE